MFHKFVGVETPFPLVLPSASSPPPPSSRLACNGGDGATDMIEAIVKVCELCGHLYNVRVARKELEEIFSKMQKIFPRIQSISYLSAYDLANEFDDEEIKKHVDSISECVALLEEYQKTWYCPFIKNKKPAKFEEIDTFFCLLNYIITEIGLLIRKYADLLKYFLGPAKRNLKKGKK